MQFVGQDSVQINSGDYAEPLPPTVRTTFLGLYGVDAAVPTHYLDDIVQREEGHEAVEAFLDQFNHRVVTLLYRAWKKYRYPESFRYGGADTHSKNLLCLVGLGWGNKPARAGLPDARMLALLGLLFQRTRTPEGLAGVIALGAPGVEVHVDEFWPVARRAGRAMPLTSTFTSERIERKGLGSGYVLGKRLPYRSRAVRVTLQPQNAQQAGDLLPGAWLHRDLKALITLYVGTKADVHLRMRMSSRFAPAPSVGIERSDGAPRLGWTVVLPSQQERFITVELGACEAFPMPPPNPYLGALAA